MVRKLIYHDRWENKTALTRSIFTMRFESRYRKSYGERRVREVRDVFSFSLSPPLANTFRWLGSLEFLYVFFICFSYEKLLLRYDHVIFSRKSYYFSKYSKYFSYYLLIQDINIDIVPRKYGYCKHIDFSYSCNCGLFEQNRIIWYIFNIIMFIYPNIYNNITDIMTV